MRRRSICALLAVAGLVGGVASAVTAPGAVAITPRAAAVHTARHTVVRASIVGLRARAVSPTTVRLSWHGFAPRGVRIAQAFGPLDSDATTAARLGAGRTSWVQRGLVPGRVYTYAVDAVGARAKSLPATVRLPRVPSRTRPDWHRSVHLTVTKATGKISGTVTDVATGAGVGFVDVIAYLPNGSDGVETLADGSYTLSGLPSTASGYTVCFDAEYADTTERDGLASQCYQGVAWNGGDTLPGGTTPVPVSSGTITTGINASLSLAGAVSGKVTDAGGNGLDQVGVDVFDSGQQFVTNSYTSANGKYEIDGISPGSYTVCFDASQVDNGSAAGGYVSQCYQAVSWNGEFYDLPGGAKPVSVGAGNNTSNVNAKLTAGGAISGTVTEASTGDALQDVDVTLYDKNDNYLTDINTASNGTYSFTGLGASSAGYFVCFDGSYASGGTSAAGYIDQCYDDASYDGYEPSSDATPVPVSTGGVANGVDAQLADGGAISGTVTAASSGTALANVDVVVFAPGDGYDSVADGYTNNKGKYTVSGLPASPDGYTVCFDATFLNSSTGFLDQCYQNVYWDQNGLPSGTTSVPVAAGVVSGGIDAALAKAGAISGKVTDSAGTGIGDVYVDVITSDGDYLAQPQTAPNGTYTATGLLPSSSGYDVCFDPEDASGGVSASGYLAQCWKNQPWNDFNDPPSGSTPVSVTAATVHAKINAKLAPAAGVSGTVTAASDGTPLGDVSVQVFDSTGNSTYGTATAEDGTYQLVGLPTSKAGYTVCFQAASDSGGPAEYGYAPQCYDDVAWDGSYSSLPAGVTSVPAKAGVLSSNIDAQLADGGAIAGTLAVQSVAAAGPDGVPANAVSVEVFAPDGTPISGEIGTVGQQYEVDGLAPSAGGYTVCFNPFVSSGSSTGYQDQCYDQVPWIDNGGPLPSGTTPVPVSAGARTSGIDSALLPGGAVSGTVTETDGTAAQFAEVDVFAADGSYLAETDARQDGTYKVTGLPASSGDIVCFAADTDEAQCYKKRAWNGDFGDLPSGTTPVKIVVGATRAKVNAVLAPPAR